MTTITHWIDTPLAEALGWVLLHSLWQGAAIALLLAGGLILARSLSSSVRYWMALSALLALLVACIGTFTWLYEPQPEVIAQEVTLSYYDAQEVLSTSHTPTMVEAATDHPTTYLNYFEQHLPLLVSGWLLGVLLLSLRMLGEIAYIQHLRFYRCRQPEGIWLEKLLQIKERMGIRREVQMRETHRIHGPMVVGVFKQFILLPAGLLSNLPPEQVEAVLAHELAHVRRNDYLTNLFVSLAEILLFFNPMMWWISQKIRAEREHACDDLAVEMTGDTLSLVRSLALMEEWRLNGSASLSMAFMGKDGSVLSRIQRLLHRSDKGQVAARTFWSVSIVCICVALLAFQTNIDQVVPIDIKVESNAIAEQPEPVVEAETGTPQAFEAVAPPTVLPKTAPQPTPEPLSADTIPAAAREIEKEMRQLEEKMLTSERVMHQKEKELRSKELLIRKESQEEMQTLRKALMELEMQRHNKEYEREMLESEFEIAEHELEFAHMKLHEEQQALELKEAELREAEGPELEQQRKAYQQRRRELLEKERALEMQQFEVQKSQRMQSFEKDKALQALQTQRFQLEQQIEMKEQEIEFKMMGLHHEMQQWQLDQQLKQEELHARFRALEAKMEELGESKEE